MQDINPRLRSELEEITGSEEGLSELAAQKKLRLMLDRIVSSAERIPDIAEQKVSDAESALKQGDFIRVAEYFHVAYNLDPRDEYRREELNALYRAWLKGQEEEEKDPRVMYGSAVSLVEVPNFTLDDITGFSEERVKEWGYDKNHNSMGIFLAAMVNKVINPEESVTLKSDCFVGYFGSFHERGTLIIEPEHITKTTTGDEVDIWGCGNHIGYAMSGGEVIAKRGRDGVGEGYGNNMVGGELVIELVRGGGLSNMEGGRAVVKSFAGNCSSGTQHIGNSQSGGLIEILDDVPFGIRTLSSDQTGGKLKAYKDVASHLIGSDKIGGETVLGSISSSALIGQGMTDGEIIVEGDIRMEAEHLQASIAYMQKGGRILVKGDAQGDIGTDASPDVRIRVEGDFHGLVGCNSYGNGIDIFIGKDVQGRVGCGRGYMNCVIKGDVYGDVGEHFGNPDAKHDGKIEIFGDVRGTVGEGMYPRSEVVVHGKVDRVGEIWGGTVRVHGNIGEIASCTSGKVYHGSIDVTKTAHVKRIAENLLGKIFGAD